MTNKYRIFVAEDNPGDVYLIREALREHSVPHELTVAADGQDACDYFKTLSGEDACPDLVMLDLNLPRVNGITILEHIKSNEVCAQTPVLVLTSSSAPRDRQQALALGALQFLQKPSGYDEFIEIGGVIKQVLLTNGPGQDTGAGEIRF